MKIFRKLNKSERKEARHDLRMLLDKTKYFLTHGDGYYARSIEDKWHMSTRDLAIASHYDWPQHKIKRALDNLQQD